MNLSRFFVRRFHMRVDVISRDIIKPSSPTPNHLKNFKLSLLEQLGPTIFGPMVFFYSAHNNNNKIKQTAQLKKSLSATLTHFYPLAGRLNGNISIDCNDYGVDFLEAKVDSPLSTLLQSPSSDILHQLIPTSVDSIETKTVEIPVFDTVKYFPPTTFHAPVVEPEIKMNQVLSKRFVFESLSIQALQAKSSSFEVNQPTRVEAVSALIWKCAMKAARNVSGVAKPSVLATSASLRPPFSKNSIGNLVSYFAVKVKEGENLRKLQSLVYEIRKAKQRFRDVHVPKLVGNTNVTEVVCSYQKEAGDMIASGVFDFYIFSSACRFGLYETDFGWGKPVWVGFPSVRMKNIVTLFDTKEVGGIEAWVNLNEQEMKCFEQDRQLLGFATLNPSVIQPFLHVF